MKPIARPDEYTFPLTKWFSTLVRQSRHIPVEQYDDETPITVQSKEDGIVTHCNHAGAYKGLFFSDKFWKDEIIEMPHHALLCDKCNAWQDEEGNWNE